MDKRSAVQDRRGAHDIERRQSRYERYTTRSNWTGTFPTEQLLAINDQIIAQQFRPTIDDVPTDPNAKMLTTNGGKDALALNLMGKDFDDPQWEDLLDRMSFDEMA